jgi:hypothetical protein
LYNKQNRLICILTFVFIFKYDSPCLRHLRNIAHLITNLKMVWKDQLVSQEVVSNDFLINSSLLAEMWWISVRGKILLIIASSYYLEQNTLISLPLFLDKFPKTSKVYIMFGKQICSLERSLSIFFVLVLGMEPWNLCLLGKFCHCAIHTLNPWERNLRYPLP